MRVGSLFSGIGGFDLGLERAGMQVAWQVENNEYCNRVLEKHWPRVTRYGDITGVDWRQVEPVDLVCGGFPCQPFSLAGKRRGTADNRYLWPEVVRCLSEVRPSWFLGENVPGITNMALDTVLTDLESLGYEVWTFNIPACAVDAPHQRKRVWILAHSTRELPHGSRACRPGRGEFTDGSKNISHPDKQSMGRPAKSRGQCCEWPTEPNVGRVAHGVPARVDRLKGLGNAVVPQIPEILGRMILQATYGVPINTCASV